MPSTFVHALLPAACLFVSLRPKLDYTRRFGLLLLCMFLGNFPDIDLIPACLFPQYWTLIHREWGHNFLSVAIEILVGGALLTRFFPDILTPAQGRLAALGLVGSHLVLDAMCYSHVHQFAGVPLLWPFIEHEFHLGIQIFPGTKYSSSLHPMVGHITSSHFWHQVILHEIIWGCVLFAVWWCCLNAYRLLKRSFSLAGASKSLGHR